MALKYSVVLATLASSPGGQVWEDPDTVLGAVADAGYDGVDLDAEPDRIDEALFYSVVDKARNLGLRIPSLLGRVGRLARRRGARPGIERRVETLLRRRLRQALP